MKPKTWVNRVLQTSVFLLLLSAGGLTLLAQHAREQANVVIMLLALYLASWSYVLGIVGLVLVPVLELIGRYRVKRAAMSRYSSVEPRRRDFEKPEMEGTQCLQRDVAPVALSRSSRQSDDRNKAGSSTRVA